MHRVIFYIFSIVAVIIYACQKFDVPLPTLINNYLNDFLCLPVVLHLCRYCISRLLNNKWYTINLFTALSVAAYYAVYFEYFIPKVNPRYTADPVDAALYFCGALLYYILQQQPPNPRRGNSTPAVEESNYLKSKK